MTGAKTATMLFATTTAVLFLAATISPVCGSDEMMDNREIDQGSEAGDDGVCLLSLRSMRAKVANALQADQSDAEGDHAMGLLAISESDTDTNTARGRTSAQLMAHAKLAKALKTWLEKQQTLNQATASSGNDFDKFLANARSGTGFCHVRLMDAKRALDGLTRNIQEMTMLVTGHETDLEAQTEGLRVSTMNLRSLEEEMEVAKDECNKEQIEAQAEFAGYVDELAELKAMSNPDWAHDVTMDVSKMPRFYQVGSPFSYCGGEQLAHFKQTNNVECKHKCDVDPQCGGYTFYDHAEAKKEYSCMLFETCDRTYQSKFTFEQDPQGKGIFSFRKGPACNEALDGQPKEYRGCQDTTATGHRCMGWTESNWEYYYESNDLGGDQHNYCRDPNGQEGKLWCPLSKFEYWEDNGQHGYWGSWEYCDPLEAAQPAAPAAPAAPDQQQLVLLDTDHKCKAFLDYQRRHVQAAGGHRAAMNRTKVSFAQARSMLSMMTRQGQPSAPEAAGATSAVVPILPPATQGTGEVVTKAPVVPVLPPATEAPSAAPTLPGVVAEKLDACGCHKGTGWSRAQNTCLKGKKTGPDEAACCAGGGKMKLKQSTGEDQEGTGASAAKLDKESVCVDACGCYPGMGWCAEHGQCEANEATSEFEAGCCSAGEVPQEDMTCKALTCEDYDADGHRCQAQAGCEWDGEEGQCVDGGTCCAYYALKGTRLATAPTVIGTKASMEAAMALCDARGAKCEGVQRNANGSFSAVSYGVVAGGSGGDTVPGRPEDQFFPRGQCRRETGVCSRAIGGKPKDLEFCEEQQEDLQDKYHEAVEEVGKLKDEAAIAMSDETLKKCRKHEGDRFTVSLTELEDATEENAELCAKTAHSVEELSPTLVTLQGDYDDLGPLIEELKTECAEAGEVSTYLTAVRDAIMNLEDCPGSMALDLPHKTEP